VADIDAVTFDYWNTLIWEEAGFLEAGRLDAWAGILEEAGIDATRDTLAAAHGVAFAAYQSAWKANEQFQVPDAVELMVRHLDLSVPDALRLALVEAFSIAGGRTKLHPADNVEACLRRLKDAGVKLGIVCDVGLTPSPVLREHLDRRGLLELFDGWTFSDEVGVYKPSPRIFEIALDELGVDAARAAHVGDRRRTDVGGALAAGMTAVRYTGVFDDDDPGEPEGHHVVADLADLPTTLRG
jgi:putative hydrolase of the HAD superfamily